MVAPIFASSAAGITPTGTPSASGGAIGTADRSWELFAGDIAVLTGASRTSGSAGFSGRLSTTATVLGWTLRDNSGNDRIRLNRVSTTVYNMQYWDGSAWQSVGSSFDFGSVVYSRIEVDFSGCGTAAGTLSWTCVSVGAETVLGSGSGTGLQFSSFANVTTTRCVNNGSGDIRFGNVFMRDGSGASTYVYSNAPTADGSDTAGTGTFASVNDVGTSYDTTFISLPTSGNQRSVKTGARVYDNRTVKAIGFEARLRCGATGPTQCKPYLKIGGTRYYWGTQTLTTAFLSYVFVWETDPSTGIAWTLTNAQAATLEFGIEVV